MKTLKNLRYQANRALNNYNRTTEKMASIFYEKQNILDPELCKLEEEANVYLEELNTLQAEVNHREAVYIGLGACALFSLLYLVLCMVM